MLAASAAAFPATTHADLVSAFAAQPADLPSTDGTGECTVGPLDFTCSVASGHHQRGCLSDDDCGTCIGGTNAGAVRSAVSACPGGTCGIPTGTCIGANRPCFLTGSTPGFGDAGTGTLVAKGMGDVPVRDTASPVIGSVSCAEATGSGAINAIYGLPGPQRSHGQGTSVSVRALQAARPARAT